MYNPYLICQYCFPGQGNSFQNHSVNECRCNKQKQLTQHNNEEHKKSSGIGSGILAGAVTGGIIGIGVHQFGKHKKDSNESSHHNHSVLKDIAIGAISGAVTGGIGKAVINKIQDHKQ